MNIAAMKNTVISLENCDLEPIHIPGMIQSHGALVAFGRDATLKHHSSNAEQLLGHIPKIGEHIGLFHFDYFTTVYQLIFDYIEDVAQGRSLLLTFKVVASNEDVYDLVIHYHNEMIIAEFELRFLKNDDANLFSIKSQKAINAVRQQKTIQEILDVAVTEIRELTGFDRVMAYQFSQDESGHVRSEAKRQDLDSLIDRRYPASDIPTQARRLYVLNTLRLIADVNAVPVALLSQKQQAPLDLSFSVLRSVSPIHIEYLQNMGVAASMSISIVINNKLWGLIACHHMSALQVPYSVRMGCDILCQILGSAVHSLEVSEFSRKSIETAKVRARLVYEIMKADDFSAALFESAEQLRQLMQCDAIFISYGSQYTFAAEPEVPNLMLPSLVAWLESKQVNFYHYFSRENFPAELVEDLGIYTGGLALCIDKANKSWIIFLRKEKIETIAWAGFPEKEYKAGPLGMRLTPRGSFEEWKETVKGKCEPWDATDVATAQALHVNMLEICNARNAENGYLRVQLMAILGHDLRDPLHTINMATNIIEKIDGSSRMSERIKKSSSRMERLINDVMDMVKLQNGMGLGIKLVRTNIHHLLNETVEENLINYPNNPISYLGQDVEIDLDPDRVIQVVNNLLSNARTHGNPGEDIEVVLSQNTQSIKVAIVNKGEAIPADVSTVLFNPFKRQSLSNERNKAGVGLGLFIAKEVMVKHAGDISYSYDHEKSRVIFELTFSAH